MSPKRPHDSRTLRLAHFMLGLGALVGVIPELVTDPAIQPLIHAMLPDNARRGFALFVAIIGFYVRHLRMTTTAPIAGKWTVPDKLEPR